MKGGIYMTIFYRKNKVVYFGLLCMVMAYILVNIWLDPLEVYAKEDLSMYSGSYALMDGDTGRVLTGKNETEPMANASTTKILTCIVTLENCSLDETVVVSANAAAQPKVRLGMKEGEEYSLKDLLYGLMLESYNDCAVAIAEHVAGSEEGFAKMMNEKAKEIGCVDTYFITPNGLDEEDEVDFHHTTASDLCKIMAYCTWDSPMKEQFLQITQTKNYTGSSNGKEYSFVNHNAFLDQMEGVISGKTGFTAKAGYCYVAALEQDGERYCIALLACGWPNNKSYKWSDARTLFNYGLKNYEIKTVRVEDIQKKIEVEGYVGNPVFSCINQNMNLQMIGEGKEYRVLLAEGETIEPEVILYEDTGFPIEEEQVLGVCNLYLEDMLLDTITLKSDKTANVWSFNKIMEMIFLEFFTFSS